MTDQPKYALYAPDENGALLPVLEADFTPAGKEMLLKQARKYPGAYVSRKYVKPPLPDSFYKGATP